MRKALILLLVCVSGIYCSFAQNLSYTCPRAVTVSCGPACLTLNAKFPDLRALSDDYKVANVTASSGCYPPIAPGIPGSPTSITSDDTYSSAIPLTFNFPFYGLNNSSILVSTNGYLCFDLTRAGLFSHYGILNGGGFLSASSGPPQNVPSTLYDKSLIMGPYHDLDPSVANSPTKQIKYDIIGTAPNRKFIVSFYKEPLFLGACNTLFQNTQQIILHESSGLIEVYVADKQICNGWNNGLAMIGLQDDTKTKGITAPGRAASSGQWGTVGMNETWRFIPKNGASLYRSVELLNAGGAVIATGDTSRVDASTLEWNFTNVCPPPNIPTLYVVKTTYQKIDAAGTFYSLDSITVLRQNSLAANITMTPTSCGASTGSVTVTPTAGTGPYTYVLNGGAPVSAPGAYTFTNLAAGPYTVVVTDASGCSNTLNINVTTTTTITGSATQTATTCPLSLNGTITVTPNGGVAPYSYSLDGGAFQPGNIFIGVAAGPHTITFTDAGGCSGTVNVTVLAGSTPLTANLSSTPTSCPAVSNGTITVTVTSGTPAYQYSLDGGPFQPGNIFINVASGVHTVTVKDIFGCTGSFPVNVVQGAALSANVSSTATSCPTVNNGTITVTPTGGTAPYQYSLDGGPNQPGNVFINVTSGPHNVVFTDIFGCTGSVAVNVAQGPAITANVSSTATSCPTVSNGTITVTPTSGTAPYQYSLDGGPFQPGNVFINVASGLHNVTFRDVLGCATTLPVTVAQGAPLASTILSADPPCFNLNNGTITITPTSGTPPYQFSLNGGPNQASNVFSGLAPGAYTVTFTDAIGCTGTNNVVLTTNPPITATSTMVMPLCNGNTNGSITLSPSGGVAPYQYSINGGAAYQASPVFNGITAGTYNFLIKDALGCIYGFTFILNQPPALTAAASPIAATCNDNDGSLTVTAGGGTPAYQYSIDNGVTWQAGTVFTVSSGTFNNNIWVKDANNCIARTSTVVALIDTMRLELGADSTICIGQSVTFAPQTNAQTNIFKWTAAPTLLQSEIDKDSIANATVTPPATKKFYLTAKWGACQRIDSLLITVQKKPVAHAGNDTTICSKTPAYLNGYASNVSGLVYYTWAPISPLMTFVVPDSSSAIVIPDSTQQFIFNVKDGYGCGFSVFDTMKVFIDPPVPAFAGNDTNAVRGVPHQLFSSGGVSYVWSPAGPLNNPFIKKPLATLYTDTYFRVLVTDAIGCTATDDVFIKVYDGPTYYVPNAFSPNGDGLNDVFRPIPVGIASTDYFMVFNRFGEQVFQTREWLKGWDGKFKGKDASMGVYTWMLKGKDKNGKVVEMKGTVVLMR